MPDARPGARHAPDTTSCSPDAPSGLHKPAAGCAAAGDSLHHQEFAGEHVIPPVFAGSAPA